MKCEKCLREVPVLDLSYESYFHVWACVSKGLKHFAKQYLIDKESFSDGDAELAIGHLNQYYKLSLIHI